MGNTVSCGTARRSRLAAPEDIGLRAIWGLAVLRMSVRRTPRNSYHSRKNHHIRELPLEVLCRCAGYIPLMQHRLQHLNWASVKIDGFFGCIPHSHKSECMDISPNGMWARHGLGPGREGNCSVEVWPQVRGDRVPHDVSFIMPEPGHRRHLIFVRKLDAKGTASRLACAMRADAGGPYHIRLEQEGMRMVSRPAPQDAGPSDGLRKYPKDWGTLDSNARLSLALYVYAKDSKVELLDCKWRVPPKRLSHGTEVHEDRNENETVRARGNLRNALAGAFVPSL